LILIVVISIYPVLRSFYFSLFDIKLNDPTKSSVHTNYSIDLSSYLNYYPFLINDLDKAAPATSGDVHDKLVKATTELKQLDQKVQHDSGPTYKKISAILSNFNTPTTSESLVTISRPTANQFKTTVSQVNQLLKTIPNSQVKGMNDIKGLAHGLTSSIINPNYVGFSHYSQDLLSGRTWAALWHTVVFTVISVACEFILGLGIALLINKAFVGRGLIRATILIPWAIPTAVSAKMWQFLYDGQNGIIAKFLADIHLFHNMSDILTTGTGAMFAVILSDVWKTTPYIALLLLAGLQTIPDALYEAAAIDGATRWKQFIHITLPMLKLSILVALLFRTLDAFRVFDLVFVLTGGGPANSTETISTLAYKVLFAQTNFGEGSALSVIVFICVAIISMLFVKLLGSDLLPEGTKK
ncbi:MAG TPA: sugar ABC transporter permease, partial [Sporolactobacillaceae bacterium]|nr:sugar ABC transporter permease [Sporolactobacillaceae bacterium]